MRTLGKTGIHGALERLGELAGESDRETIAALRDRLDSARLRVLVAGEAKRGKSTLVNALLGRDVLPTGVVPLTAVAATVVHAAPAAEGIEVAFADGRTDRFPLGALADFGTERGNPANCRNVCAITVRLDAEVLARGLELVDTPGTGSVHAHNTAAADAALPSMDAAIFVLTADPPVSASERDLLRRVSSLSVALFVVLNKADYLDQDALAEAVEFTAHVVGEATGTSQRVYPLSARGAQDGSDPGFDAFAADLTAYLEAGRVAGLHVSVARHASRLGQQLLDEVALARRAALLPGEEAAEQIAAFRSRLQAVAAHQADAQDRATAQSRRLLEGLNAAAGEVTPTLVADVTARLSAVLDSELAGASPAVVGQRGRADLTRLVATAAEAWRREQAGKLEAALRALDGKLAAELEADLAGVRAEAADLLGVDLTLPLPSGRLPGDLGFFYALDEQVDQAELLAGAIRRRLPGDYGRRLARERLLAGVAGLTGSQIGRARGDLQYRLAEATRLLTADLRRRHITSTQRLSDALDRAVTIRASAGRDSERQLADLAVREQALRSVLSELTDDGPL